MNQLDLTKIAKAFGFKVPPRVNLAIGPGKGQSARAGEKRRRDEDTVSESEEDVEEEVEKVGKKLKGSGQVGDGSVHGPIRGSGKSKRIETLGEKSVKKEIFKKGKEMKKLGANWSR